MPVQKNLPKSSFNPGFLDAAPSANQEVQILSSTNQSDLSTMVSPVDTHHSSPSPVQKPGKNPQTLLGLVTSLNNSDAQPIENQNVSQFEQLNDHSAVFKSVMRSLQLASHNCLSLNMTARLPPGGMMPTTFTYFPKLPAEVRLMIWRFAHPGSRLVDPREVDRRKHYESLFIERFGKAPEEADYDYCGDFSLPSGKLTRSPPVLLHVNRESRHEALKNYELVPLRELFGGGKCKLDATIKIYFNFELDVLYVSESCLRVPWGHEPLALKGSERIKHIAYDVSLLRLQYYDIMENFRRLETCTLVRDWTNWNAPYWEDYWIFGRTKSDHGFWGLSLQELCKHERNIMDTENKIRKDCIRDNAYPDSNHPVVLLKAYVGTGRLVPAYGDYLDFRQKGPRQEPFLKGPEVGLLPQKIRDGLEELRMDEEKVEERHRQDQERFWLWQREEGKGKESLIR